MDATTTAKFENLLAAERAVDGSRAAIVYSRQRLDGMHRALTADRRRLSVALDALTVEELTAYGEYRRQGR